jgi:diguanylate cyclase (GGDEF)-like protein
MALIIAAAFMLVWAHQRQRRHLAVLAAGYALSAVGFLLQYFTLPIGFGPSRLASVTAFLLSGAFVSAAVTALYRKHVPATGLAVFGLTGLGSFSWFMFVEPDLTWRLYAVNFALGAMTLLVAAELRSAAASRPVERVLFVLALLAGLNFLLRPLVVVALNGNHETHESLYWTTAIVSHALLSLLIAFTLLASAVLDVIHDLRAETLTDPLSRLLNRRGFEARAGELLDLNARARLPVSLVIADLDRFKALNDQFGHAAGDRVIVAFSDRLKRAAGARGVAGRLGGEEFALLLPGSGLAAATQVAEAVRAGFSGTPIEGLARPARATASFGVAALSGDETLTELFARADEALYRAKTSGRDGVRSCTRRAGQGTGAAALLSA